MISFLSRADFIKHQTSRIQDEDKNLISFIMLGSAFAFKLQAIFIVPFFIYCYVRRKKFSITYFLLIPVMMILWSLHGIFAGRSIREVFDIYLIQTNTLNRVYINYGNLYSLMIHPKGNGHYDMFRLEALFTMTAVLGAGLLVCVYRNTKLREPSVFWGTVLWSLYSVSFFMPNMHDRYGYILEIDSLLYIFMVPRIGIPFALVQNLLTLTYYCAFLFEFQALGMNVCGLINLVSYVLFTAWLFFKETKNVRLDYEIVASNYQS